MLKGYNLISYTHFNPPTFELFRNRGKKKVYQTYITLDTETSHTLDNEKGWIYQWAFCYDKTIVYGRNPLQLIECFKKIALANSDGKIICYVHNLSYDFEYLYQFFQEKFSTKILALNSHKVLTFECDNIEIRCSYKLSNCSLDKWSRDLNTPHKKLVGAVDYSITRYQDSKLHRNDWRYMFYDVVVLQECIQKQMQLENDTLLSIPYTSTGYVRRDVRSRFKADKQNRVDFQKTKLDKEVYKRCRKAFAGGLTHGNRFYADKTLQGTRRHRDFDSHYPTQQMVYECPIGKFFKYYDGKNNKSITLEKILSLSKSYCYLITFIVTKAELRDKKITLPTLQAYKLYQGKLSSPDTIEDNGRILKFSGSSVLTMTDSDFEIFCRQYKADIRIVDIYTARKGRYPAYMQDTILYLYSRKSELKEELKKVTFGTPEYYEKALNLMLVKNKLNAIYGMTATNPVREEYLLQDGGEWEHKKPCDSDISDSLEKFYKSYNSFNRYQFGVWTTATARRELIEFVECIGYENYIYADTDSIFYFSTPEIEKKIEKLIEKKQAYAKSINAYAKINGKKKYFDNFQDEKEDITTFRFLHSKCYGYITSDGAMKITVAGVSQKGRGNTTREKELKSLDNLSHGFVFKKCGGTLTKYNYHDIATEYIKGHKTIYSSSAVICDNEKTLNGLIAREEQLIEWSVL